MSEEESRYTTDQALDQAYSVVVEQVVVEMIQETGVEDGTQAEVMENMQKAGWRIVRNVVERYREEIILLVKDDKIQHIGHVFTDGDEVKHILVTMEEWEKMAKARKK